MLRKTVLAACLISSFAFAADTSPMAKHPAWEMMGLDKAKTIVYTDQKGKALTEEAFVEAINKGMHFSAMKRKSGEDVNVTMSLIDKATGEGDPTIKINLKAGDPMPAFSLKDAAGKTVDSNALKGKYTLLSFYFGECGPCVKEVPELNALAKSTPGLNYLAVTWDTKKDVQDFVSKYKLDWQVVPEAKDFIDKVGVKSYPSVLLFDPKGALVAVADGQGKANLAKWVESKRQ